MGESTNTQSKSDGPKPETLQVQLSELNNRTRWYSSQLWHIPFAYFGILVVVVVQMFDDKAPAYLTNAIILISIGLFGILALWHMWSIKSANEEAVKKLQETEGMLKLPETVKSKSIPMNYIPLFLALVLAVVACVIYGLKMLLCPAVP